MDSVRKAEVSATMSQKEIEERRRLETERFAERTASMLLEDLNERRRRIERERFAKRTANMSREDLHDRGRIKIVGIVHCVSQSGPYCPLGGVEEMREGGRKVRLESGAYITV
ncbi:hypothetical protein FHG87_001431 [Trinorchestia longiramus]|nr:hypothetical protein FHG87_001431 [Trinorchestia longiramus]